MNNAVTKEQLVSLCSKIEASTRPSMLTETLRESYSVGICNAWETSEEIAKLQTALGQISPDIGRGVGSIDLNTHNPADYWLGVVWAIKGLKWSCGEKMAQNWSKKSNRYTDEGFEKSWTGYNPNHPKAIGIGSVYRLAQIFELNSFGPLVFTADQAATILPVNTAHSPYTFQTAAEIELLPPITWRVKGLLPEQGLASIYGPSGSGKSFLVIDLIAKIASGDSFFGLRTKPCPVVYVALEGTSGIAKRIKAYEDYHKTTLPSSFRIVTDMLSLLNSDASVFAESIKGAGLDSGVIVIDTLAQSAPGFEENSSADMGRVISNAQLLQRKTGGLVILVHHTGKDAGKGARGHSSLTAALDAAIELKRPASGREWLVAKSKDGEDGIARPFRLEVVELGLDEDSETITSCVAVGDLFRQKQLQAPQGRNQKAVLVAIKNAFKLSEVLSENEIIELAEAALPNSGSNTKQRGKEAVNGLLSLGHIVEKNSDYKLV